MKYRARTYYTTEQKAEMLDADRQQTTQIRPSRLLLKKPLRFLW